MPSSACARRPGALPRRRGAGSRCSPCWRCWPGRWPAISRRSARYYFAVLARHRAALRLADRASSSRTIRPTASPSSRPMPGSAVLLTAAVIAGHLQLTMAAPARRSRRLHPRQHRARGAGHGAGIQAVAGQRVRADLAGHRGVAGGAERRSALLGLLLAGRPGDRRAICSTIPSTVRGKRVIDFAAGSGVSALAAARAGAASVVANDIDACRWSPPASTPRPTASPFEVSAEDWLAGPDGAPGCRRRDRRRRLLRARHVGARARLAARPRARSAGWCCSAIPGATISAPRASRSARRYEIPTSLQLENRGMRETVVWRVLPHP